MPDTESIRRFGERVAEGEGGGRAGSTGSDMEEAADEETGRLESPPSSVKVDPPFPAHDSHPFQ